MLLSIFILKEHGGFYHMLQTGSLSAARRRIEKLLDDRSFVEIGARITARSTDFNMGGKQIPSDGVITGYGRIEGSLVYVYSQDAEILGGSLGEMHAKKIANLYSLAIKTGAPLIGFVDCSGFRLQEGTDALDAFGSLYINQSRAKGVILQIQGIFGRSAGGMAISSVLSDFTFMESRDAKLFINSPNAIAKHHQEKCDTSSADFQSKKAGNIDGAGTEDEIIAGIRTLVSILPANNEENFSHEECRDDLNRKTEQIASYRLDTGLLLAEVSDGHFYLELKEDFAPEMLTAFIRLNGRTIGCIANRGEKLDREGKKQEDFELLLTDKGCNKAAEFVEFCDAFRIPVLSLVNVKGFAATCCTEKRLAGSGAKLLHAFTKASVPKLSLLIGEAFGSAYLCMNAKSTGADLVFAWEDAAIGLMDAKEAARIIYADEIAEAKEPGELLREKTKEYHQLQSSVESAARRGCIDDIIAFEDTRKKLIFAFEILLSKKENREWKKYRGF